MSVCVVFFFSLWELIVKTDGRLSVLRAFRLLQIVKLVHFFPYHEGQLQALNSTMKEAAPLCGLLLLVIFIFRQVDKNLL